MSGEKGFLRRWSRRKLMARLPHPAEPAPDQPQARAGRAEQSAGQAAARSMSSPAQSPEPLPPSLPPIATICEGTDIRPFLEAGVPEEMTRAALRRAWSTDPVIRGFVGLSENFWDVASESGIPGFGSLTVDEARRLLAQVAGLPEAADKEQSNSAASEPPTTPAPKPSDT